MHRRRVLALLAAGAVPLAGCSSGDGDPPATASVSGLSAGPVRDQPLGGLFSTGLVH